MKTRPGQDSGNASRLRQLLGIGEEQLALEVEDLRADGLVHVPRVLERARDISENLSVALKDGAGFTKTRPHARLLPDRPSPTVEIGANWSDPHALHASCLVCRKSTPSPVWRSAVAAMR
jgi:hypothetical protein